MTYVWTTVQLLFIKHNISINNKWYDILKLTVLFVQYLRRVGVDVLNFYIHI
jgi:hypothetical protein